MTSHYTYVNTNEKAHILPLYINSAEELILAPSEQRAPEAFHYTLVVCTYGSLHIHYAELSFTVSENHGFIAYKGTKCKITAGKKGCHLKMVLFDGTGVTQILSYFSLSGFQVFSVDFARFDADFRSIQFNVRMNFCYRASLSFQQVIYEIFNVSRKPVRGKNIDLLNRYIIEHYTSDLDIQTLADIYGTSVSYLCREFKSKYGISPIAYVSQLRIEKARHLLATTRAKVSDIAADCGFISTEYFCSVFKKHAHCTPLQYRHRNTALASETDPDRTPG